MLRKEVLSNWQELKEKIIFSSFKLLAKNYNVEVKNILVVVHDGQDWNLSSSIRNLNPSIKTYTGPHTEEVD